MADIARFTLNHRAPATIVLMYVLLFFSLIGRSFTNVTDLFVFLGGIDTPQARMLEIIDIHWPISSSDMFVPMCLVKLAHVRL